MRWLLVLTAMGYALPAAAIQLTIGQNYTGSTQATSGYVPPDTMGAVGLEHVTQFVNGEFRAYDKATGTLLQRVSNDRFWLDAGVAAYGAFDPRIQYDPFVDRWYALSSGHDDFLLAVSKGGDPTAGWSAFKIDADSTDTFWVDFPMLGFDADGVYFSANMIPNSGVGNWTTEVVVVPKADLLDSTPTVAGATAFERLSLAKLVWTPQLAIDLDGAGLPMPILAVSIPAALQSAQIEGPVTAPALGGLGSTEVIWDPDEVGPPPAAEQPGPAQNLEVFGLGRFTSNTVVRNGKLWGARAVEHFAADGDQRSAVQWWQIDPDTDTALQIGYIIDDELDLFEPSIAVNEFDQVVIGLNGSSETEYASAYAVAGETVDGVTTFGNLVLLAAGLGPYEQAFDGRNRWGDYSATVIDPSDPHRFWTFQEWADAGNAWATQITELVLVPEPATGVLVMAGLLGLAYEGRRRG